MAKITKFKHTLETYYDLGIEKGDAGDYIGCLDMLLSAKKNIVNFQTEMAFDISLELAETYAKMGLYEKSNAYYLNMLNYDYCLNETLFGLIRNYLLLDMQQAALFYIQFGLKEKIFDEEDDIETLLSEFTPQKRLRLVNNDDGEYVLQVAKQLMNNNDTEYSRQMLSSVSPSSAHYLESLNCLALIEMSAGNISKGIEYCDKALLLNENDINAVTTKLLGLKMSGNIREAEKLMTAIDELEICEMPELSRLIICFAEMENDSLTKKYTDLALNMHSFDLDINLLNIISSFNLGAVETARKRLVEMNIIFPDEIRVKKLFEKFDSNIEKGSRINLNFDLDDNDYIKLYENIEEFLNLKLSNLYFCKYLKENDGLFLNVYKLLKEGRNFPLINRVNTAICSSENCEMTVRNLLSDPELSIISKKNLFYNAIKFESYTMSVVVKNNISSWYSPYFDRYDFKSLEIMDAYCKLFACVAFLDTDFERKLKSQFKKFVDIIVKNYPVKYKFNSQALAAVIAYKSKINIIFSKKEACCEIFDAKKELFDEYESAFGDNIIKAREPKKTNTKEKPGQ